MTHDERTCINCNGRRGPSPPSPIDRALNEIERGQLAAFREVAEAADDLVLEQWDRFCETPQGIALVNALDRAGYDMSVQKKDRCP
jgi:hypothetical protein